MTHRQFHCSSSLAKKILLCSDIEKPAQAELLRLYPDLIADVVVVPHHGLVKSLDADFLERLDAKILVCSCGRSDYQRNRIIKSKSKSKWLCTAEHGALVVCIDKDGKIR
jgi:beta-lactamase superfamily II metal-dependent hydrolase